MLNGAIVTTTGSDIHKRIVAINGTRFDLEFYSEIGRQVETVSAIHLTFVASQPTKQFLELKVLFENASHSFHNEIANRQKKAKRIELSRRRNLSLNNPQTI